MIKHFYFNNVQKYIDNFKHWFKFKFVKRYHIIDIRQPLSELHKNKKTDLDYYEYGYLDVDDRMLYACMNLLKQHFQDNNLYNGTDRSIQETNKTKENMNGCFREYFSNLDEARAILYWWEVERKRNFFVFDKKWKKYNELSAIPQAPESKMNKIYKEIVDLQKMMDDQEDEMMIRLMKIRRTLWD